MNGQALIPVRAVKMSLSIFCSPFADAYGFFLGVVCKTQICWGCVNYEEFP